VSNFKKLRYFFHIGYNGTHYRGWQRQIDAISIQQVFEENLSLVFKNNITCIGCGRTDAEVHASQYFFHIDVTENWNFDLLSRLNIMLPRDIAVFDIIKVEENSHAQFDANSRTYDYFIHTFKDPFLNELSSLYIERNLDLAKMQTAANLLKNHNDFRAFCLTPDKGTTTICNITEANIFCDKNRDKIRFQFTSNRFLRGMVRIIVRMLLEIGKGKLSIDEFENYLISKEIKTEQKLAFPQGLYLSKVTYPFIDIKQRAEFFAFANSNNWIAV
jgi:tRNA pseudouridine38-40 synthase